MEDFIESEGFSCSKFKCVAVLELLKYIMSCETLEAACLEVKKARNLSYYGRYTEARDDFSAIIQRLEKYDHQKFR